MMKRKLLSFSEKRWEMKLEEMTLVTNIKDTYSESQVVMTRMVSPWNKEFWLMEESDCCWSKDKKITDQEELVKEKENQSEGALLDQILQF